MQDSAFVLIDAQVINTDVPFFLELDVLKQLKLFLEFEGYFMKSKSEGWQVKLTDKLRSCYIE